MRSSLGVLALILVLSSTRSQAATCGEVQLGDWIRRVSSPSASASSATPAPAQILGPPPAVTASTGSQSGGANPIPVPQPPGPGPMVPLPVVTSPSGSQSGGANPIPVPQPPGPGPMVPQPALPSSTSGLNSSTQTNRVPVPGQASTVTPTTLEKVMTVEKLDLLFQDYSVNKSYQAKLKEILESLEGMLLRVLVTYKDQAGDPTMYSAFQARVVKYVDREGTKERSLIDPTYDPNKEPNALVFAMESLNEIGGRYILFATVDSTLITHIAGIRTTDSGDIKVVAASSLEVRKSGGEDMIKLLGRRVIVEGRVNANNLAEHLGVNSREGHQMAMNDPSILNRVVEGELIGVNVKAGTDSEPVSLVRTLDGRTLKFNSVTEIRAAKK